MSIWYRFQDIGSFKNLLIKLINLIQTCQPEGQEIREANRPGVVGASHAPNRGAGRRPGGGPGVEAPGSSWVYENFKVKNEVIEYTIYQLFTK